MAKDKLIGLLALLGTCVIGGAIAPSLVRIGVQNISPFTFSFLRAAVSVVILLPVLLQQREYFNVKHIWLMFTIAGLGLGFNQLFFSLGISRTTIVASQLIYTFLPLIVPIMAYFLIKEKYNNLKLAGTLVSFCGILVLMLNSGASSNELSLGTFYGNSMIFIGMIGYAIYLAVSKKYSVNFSSWFLSALSSLAITVFFAPFMGYENLVLHSESTITFPSLLIIVGAAICSILFFWLLQVSISKLSSTTVAMSSMASPQFAVLAGVIFFNEKLSILLFVSMALVLSGLVLSIMGDKQKALWEKLSLKLKIKN